MLRTDFSYDLPDGLIAQSPANPRSGSRLMLLDRIGGRIRHDYFYNIARVLKKGDLLVMNDSRVIPARLFGKKIGASPNGAVVEFLLLENKGGNLWETLVRPGKKAKAGSEFSFGGGVLKAKIIKTAEDGCRLVDFDCEGDFLALLEKVGRIPLPPYITKELSDKESYQTVYSKEPGSSAAPTAGLHFTPETLGDLRAAGIDTAFVTLHVGLGTFRPVSEDDVGRHKMHAEHYRLPKETAVRINETKANGGRVVAVGTTALRTLESVALKYGVIRESEGDTDIFILPGFDFRAADGLLTNFHLPESTLIMLVSAFAGRENTMAAYGAAVENGYRFFSFGDAMLII
jgi:S-adenosylmethionine:tRNA ribosyltransferase-isomerase